MIFHAKAILLTIFFRKIGYIYIKLIIREFIKIVLFRNINHDELFNNIVVAEDRCRLKDIN